MFDDRIRISSVHNNHVTWKNQPICYLAQRFDSQLPDFQSMKGIDAYIRAWFSWLA